MSDPAVPQKGKQRKIGICILLTVVTLGIYAIYWTIKTHGEVRDYSGFGLPPLFFVLVYLFVSPVLYFLMPYYVSDMAKTYGRSSRLSALTGLWVLLPLVGALVWFVKMQRELNELWATLP